MRILVVFLRIISLAEIIIFGLLSTITASFMFLVGFAIYYACLKIIAKEKWGDKRKKLTLLVISLVLNFVPFVRIGRDANYSSDFGQSPEQMSLGIGWPAAIVKYYFNTKPIAFFYQGLVVDLIFFIFLIPFTYWLLEKFSNPKEVQIIGSQTPNQNLPPKL